MTTQLIITNYLHYIGFMTLFACLVMEHLLIKTTMTVQEIRKLAVIDAIYGISAIIVFATGLLKVFKFGAPEYYLSMWPFHAKLTVFIIAAVLSIMPTIKILKARKTAQDGNTSVELPKFLKHIVRVELLLIALMPLLAAMMALGVGVDAG